MEETKTVITGASGWLGRELIRILVEENKIVIAEEIESKIMQPPPRTIG